MISTYMKKISIWFEDFWPNFDYNKSPFLSHIIQFLSEKYDVTIDPQDPDFLFYSCFGHKHYKYPNSVRIYICGEAIIPDFNVCDYAISQIKIDFEGRNLNFPYALWTIIGDEAQKHSREKALNRKFCSFIYSNSKVGNGSVLRKEFCRKLSEYKFVHCPGIVLHNCEAPGLSDRNALNYTESKRKYISDFKFNIAFENTITKGYITEKLTDCFISGTLPIYRGGELPTELKDAVIYANDYTSIDSLVKRVKEVDTNEDLYISILNSNPIANEYFNDSYHALDDFLHSIFKKGRTPYEKYDLYKNFGEILPSVLFLNRAILYIKNRIRKFFLR